MQLSKNDYLTEEKYKLFIMSDDIKTREISMHYIYKVFEESKIYLKNNGNLKFKF